MVKNIQEETRRNKKKHEVKLFELTDFLLIYWNFMNFFNCYFTVPRETLGHCRRGSLTNFMVKTVFDSRFDSKVTWGFATSLGPKARPSAWWSLNWDPTNSHCTTFSGSRHYNENQKTPGSNFTRSLAGLLDQTSVTSDLWVKCRIKHIIHFFQIFFDPRTWNTNFCGKKLTFFQK